MEVTEAHSEARTSDTENRLGHDTLNDNDGGLDEDKNYDEETVNLINNVAYNYVAFFIVAVGIAGNLINLVVLTRPRLKGVMYVYLLGLAVSNLCVLIIAIPGKYDIAILYMILTPLSLFFRCLCLLWWNLIWFLQSSSIDIIDSSRMSWTLCYSIFSCSSDDALTQLVHGLVRLHHHLHDSQPIHLYLYANIFPKNTYF